MVRVFDEMELTDPTENIFDSNQSNLRKMSSFSLEPRSASASGCYFLHYHLLALVEKEKYCTIKVILMGRLHVQSVYAKSTS
jgi:hypothetical protein